MDKLNECILVAGKRNGKYFLSKNRDRNFIADYKIRHKLINDIEVVFYEDTTGWAEGMNEFGVGFIYTYLMYKNAGSDKFTSKWHVKNISTIANKKTLHKTEKGNQKREDFRKLLVAKTAEEAVEHIKNLPWNGSYFIGDTNGIYEVEHFERQTKIHRCDFTRFTNFKVKTNRGDMIPYAGHLPGAGNVNRAHSDIRKIETERYLLGFKSYTDVLKRMGHQSFTGDSGLNVFRTDEQERTISQVLMDLNKRIFYFVHHDKNSNFFGIKKDLPENYNAKLRIMVRNKKEFSKNGEYDEFMAKKDDLYSHPSLFDPNVD